MAGFEANDEIIERWIEGLASGDFRSLDAYSAPDLRVWHSTDDRWADADEQRARMDRVMRMPEPPKLAGLKATPTERGFIVQGHLAAGGERTHIVQICTVEDGKVSLVEEYLAPEKP